ncbi:26S proteasome non-ATPase regulatory subunit 14 isoform X1 [Chiloscyllium plagiosum]|uniref:26S proteasome non-ATPase regulatory subunit 14 isoform X1 n=2 Tax=Orectolobiformes TaxID=30503 RepID=UPI001CB839BD|nr:26S proteasome non-ATPase regulatory subunit 14 isoform X1 [Chiloscyllium plagiosum]
MMQYKRLPQVEFSFFKQNLVPVTVTPSQPRKKRSRALNIDGCSRRVSKSVSVEGLVVLEEHSSSGSIQGAAKSTFRAKALKGSTFQAVGDMDRLLRLGGGMPGLGQGPPTDAPAVDTAEQVYISSLALLKMLKHGRAGVPMEVMGLMLGEFVDDYTVRVIDVFAMPQSGTGVSVEAVDPVFQAKMLDMLKQTGRPEMVVGWYHSHPGFGCWLSGVDINTQQSFEALSERAVAVVVDPIQSVKGKVVIDAFRLINANMMVLGHEPRQTTSNLGHLNKPSIQALIHGLNRHYYSITINYRKNELEQKMLLNLHKKSWMEGLTLQDYSEHCKLNETVVKEMLDLAKNYNKAVEEEDKMTPEQLAIKNVGKQDPKRHLEEHVDVVMTSNIVQCLAAMLDTVVFK